MVLAAECIPNWHNEQSTLENETRGSLSRGGRLKDSDTFAGMGAESGKGGPTRYLT